MDIIVCKFGGTSVATSEKIKKIVEIIKLDKRRRCIVLSAPGKAANQPVKVTDMLIEITKKLINKQPVEESLKELKKRYVSIYEPLGLSTKEIDGVLSDIDNKLNSPVENPKKLRDSIVASGEDLNCKLFTIYLNKINIDAVYINPKDAGLIVTSDFGDALPLPDSAIQMANLKTICAEKIIVFPGFFGYTKEGDIATFSRGGSDLTGSLLADALDAIEYENWTDVDGIFSANPSMVDSPMQIPALTYKEMRELSYMGFNVLHEEAVKPVIKKKIPIRLRNTNNLSNTGTLVVAERLPTEKEVVGVASSNGYCSFTLQKFLMNREKGFGRKLLGIFEELGLSYEHCPSGVDNISVIVNQKQLNSEIVNTIIRRIEVELQPDEIKTEFGIALISVVGEGLLHKIGFLSKATRALANADINIKIVNQGSSEISIIFGIDGTDEKKAVNALYKEFFS